MENRVNVLGVDLKYSTIDELYVMLDEYLNNFCMNTISLIHIPTLLLAIDDENVRGYIEDMDMTMPADRAILEAAGIEDTNILDDISDNVLVENIFKYIEKNGHTVYILGEREEDVDNYYKYLSGKYSQMNFYGKYAFGEETVNEDFIVNEINSISPDVVISVLKSPFQEEFVSNNKNKINAKLWLGLGEESLLTDAVGLKNSWLGKLIDKKILLSKIRKYDNENGE